MTEDQEASTRPAGPVTSTTEQPPPSPSPPLGSGSATGPQERARSRGRAVLGIGAVLLALVSGVVGAVGALALDDDDDRSPIATVEPGDDSDDTADGDEPAQPQPDEPLSQAAAAVLPSVVSITTGRSPFSGQGSGVIISDDGYVLTNSHVVGQAEEGGELSVALADGTTASAEVVGRDPATDLAVIQIEGVDDLESVTPAVLGDSSDLVVGDTVLAIGSPLGLDGSVSSGIVSALNRAITLSGSSPFGGGSGGTMTVIDAIQTDAAINPGNSGGPLVDTDGQVVGINTAIASLAQGPTSESGNIGVGFAIPIDDARDIADQLIEDGEATHAFLGVRLADTRGEGGETAGAVVAAVEDGSPADDAGLESGGVVAAVDGEPVRDAATLTAAIRSHAPGDEVTLTIRRDGDEAEVTATLGTLETASD